MATYLEIVIQFKGIGGFHLLIFLYSFILLSIIFIIIFTDIFRYLNNLTFNFTYAQKHNWDVLLQPTIGKTIHIVGCNKTCTTPITTNEFKYANPNLLN